MLTRLIVDFYAWIIEIFLWVFLVIAGVAGYSVTVPLLNAAGWTLEIEGAWKVLGGVCFAGAAFWMSAVLIGPSLALVDIRKAIIRAVETEHGEGGDGHEFAPIERREPTL